MADTTSSVAGNSDAPVASVNNGLGPTEIAHYIVMLGSLLASTGLHSDFGLTSHAADLAPLVLLVATLSLGIMRGIKHHSAMKYNAMTYLGQLQHVANVVAASGGNPTSLKALTAGVSALNGAIQQDFPGGAAAADAAGGVVTAPAAPVTPPTTPAVDSSPAVNNPVGTPVDPGPVDIPVPATVVDAQPGSAPALPVDTNPLPANLDAAPVPSVHEAASALVAALAAAPAASAQASTPAPPTVGSAGGAAG